MAEQEFNSEELREDDALFLPSTKDLREEYPELSGYDEFKLLSDTELKFVWAMRCQSSHYSAVADERQRCVASIQFAFGEKIEERVKRLYLSGDYPPAISEAMDVMENFRPDIRKRAKLFAESIMTDMESTRNLVNDMLLTKKVDLESLKLAFDIKLKILKELPSALIVIEAGFGMRKKAKKTGVDDFSLADRILEEGF